MPYISCDVQWGHAQYNKRYFEKTNMCDVIQSLYLVDSSMRF